MFQQSDGFFLFLLVRCQKAPHSRFCPPVPAFWCPSPIRRVLLPEAILLARDPFAHFQVAIVFPFPLQAFWAFVAFVGATGGMSLGLCEFHYMNQHGTCSSLANFPCLSKVSTKVGSPSLSPSWFRSLLFLQCAENHLGFRKYFLWWFDILPERRCRIRRPKYISPSEPATPLRHWWFPKTDPRWYWHCQWYPRPLRCRCWKMGHAFQPFYLSKILEACANPKRRGICPAVGEMSNCCFFWSVRFFQNRPHSSYGS